MDKYLVVTSKRKMAEDITDNFVSTVDLLSHIGW